MTSLPLPTLDSSKQEALNELLLDLRSKTNIPAACYAITTAKGTIYEFAAGDRIHGEPDNGQVTMDTRRFPSTYSEESMLKNSPISQHSSYSPTQK